MVLGMFWGVGISGWGFDLGCRDDGILFCGVLID